MQSRYYNPEWGRFVNADAIAAVTGELLSGNMFAYCINNPINMRDNTGFRPVFDSPEEQRAYEQWLGTKNKASLSPGADVLRKRSEYLSKLPGPLGAYARAEQQKQGYQGTTSGTRGATSDLSSVSSTAGNLSTGSTVGSLVTASKFPGMSNALGFVGAGYQQQYIVYNNKFSFGEKVSMSLLNALGTAAPVYASSAIGGPGGLIAGGIVTIAAFGISMGAAYYYENN